MVTSMTNIQYTYNDQATHNPNPLVVFKDKTRQGKTIQDKILHEAQKISDKVL